VLCGVGFYVEHAFAYAYTEKNDQPTFRNICRAHVRLRVTTLSMFDLETCF